MHALARTHQVFAIWIAVGMTLAGTIGAASTQPFDPRTDGDRDEDARLEQIEYREPQSLLAPNDEGLMSDLGRLGLIQIDNFFAPMLSLLHVAHVLASGNLSHMVTLRYDYSPKDVSLQGRVIELPSGRFLLHTKDLSKRPVTLYFEGFQRAEINKVVLAVSRSSSVSPLSAKLFSFLIPKAHAQSASEACGVPAELGKTFTMGDLDAVILQHLGACSKNFLTGAASSIANILPFSLLTGAAFTQIRTLWTTGKSLMKGAHLAFPDDMAIAVALHPSLVVEAICEFLGQFVGNMVVGMGMAEITGGASLPMKALQMISEENEFASKLHAFVAASSLLTKGEHAAEKTIDSVNKVRKNSFYQAGRAAYKNGKHADEDFKEQYVCVASKIASATPSNGRMSSMIPGRTSAARVN